MPEVIESRLKELQNIEENFEVTGRNNKTGKPINWIQINTVKNFDKVFFRQQLDHELILELDCPTQKENNELYFKKIKPILLENKINFEVWATQSKSLHIHIFFNKPISNTERKAFVEYFFDWEVIKGVR